MFRTSSKIVSLLVPSAVVISKKETSESNKSMVCRPSELPLYASSDVASHQHKVEPQLETVVGNIEKTVSQFRVFIQSVFQEYNAYKRVGKQSLYEGLDQAESFLKYLRQENNTSPKAGAIVIGGLTGFILGLRGGFFKRTLYATTGAVALAAVCYPKEAAEYACMGVEGGKKNAMIAYNFIYGVKKGDPPVEFPTLPTFPTTFSEAWNTLNKTAISFVSDTKPSNVKESTKEDGGKD